MLQLRLQGVDLDQGVVVGAVVLRGLDHHHVLVAAGRVVADHEGVVEVIARVRSELGGARIEVPDFDLQADDEARDAQHARDDQGQCCPFQLGETIQECPERMPTVLQVVQSQALRFGFATGGGLADPGVGQQHGQQY
ncbi:hypothetical protein D9M68_494560 [compost metagenome]